MKKIFSIVVFFFAVAVLNAATVFVTSVDDANKALNAAKAGDNIILKSGVYTNAVIRFVNNNGTEKLPVTFIAEKTGNVFFEGNSSVAFAGSYVNIEGFVWRNGGKDLGSKAVVEFRNSKQYANNSKLVNCTIDGFNNADLNQDNKWVSLFGTYNTVSNCLFKDKFNVGATLVVWLPEGQSAYHLVNNNYFLNRQNGPDANNGLESIRCGDSKSSMTAAHCVFAFNRFENCDGETEIISNKSCFNSYVHNTFFNSDGGLTLRHGNNCLVDGNVFDGNGKKGSYGVRIIGENHTVTNNLFYNLNGNKDKWRAPLGIINGQPQSPAHGYFQVKNAIIGYNIFINNNSAYIRVGAGKEANILAPDSVSIIHNFLYNDTDNDVVSYESISKAEETHFSIDSNVVVGKNMQANKSGFNKLKYKTLVRSGYVSIKDDKGVNIIPENKIILKTKSGASVIPQQILDKIHTTKYTYLTKTEVGLQL